MSDFVLDDEPERVRRLELLATNIRKKYGRSVLRSCGVDDIQGRGIVQLALAPRADFDPGTPLPSIRPRLQKGANGWGLVEALELIARLRRDLQGEGWGIGLAGSVLHTGWSLNDLDVICFPLSTAEAPSLATLHRHLEGNGLRERYSAGQVREHWRGKGSLDEKHVEIWSFGRKRVDVFVLS